MKDWVSGVCIPSCLQRKQWWQQVVTLWGLRLRSESEPLRFTMGDEAADITRSGLGAGVVGVVGVGGGTETGAGVEEISPAATTLVTPWMMALRISV